MGPDPSKPIAGNVHPYTNDLYMPMPANSGDDDYMPQPSTRNSVVHRVSLHKSPFQGVWSVLTPSSICPCPRTGEFFVQDIENKKLYVGYGLDRENNPLCDLWELDLVKYVWREIPLSGQTLCARVGSRALIHGKFLVIFGGYCNPVYFAELHTIDITTGEVRVVETSGPQPPPRSTPIIAIHNNKFYVWGGFNGEMLTTLHILDLGSLMWSEKPQDVQGRTAAPYQRFGNKIYSYGSSKMKGLLEIDLETETVQILPTTGAEPNSGLMSAGSCAVENLLFFFGGKANSEYSLMYACDINKKWWFVFHIVPDGESTTTQDGSVSEIGLFLLPRLTSFVLTYVPDKRELLATLGEPMKDPPQLFLVQIGEALGVIHMRDDMVDALHNSNPATFPQ